MSHNGSEHEMKQVLLIFFSRPRRAMYKKECNDVASSFMPPLNVTGRFSSLRVVRDGERQFNGRTRLLSKIPQTHVSSKGAIASMVELQSNGEH